jgi:uroporphyrinogen-III synthase
VAIFISPTAVAHGARWSGAARTTLAVGAGTAQELRKLGVEAIFPTAGADSEMLLALPELAAVAGKRIAIVRGEGGRSLLGDTLRARGAEVRTVECYRRVPPGADAAPLLAALLAEWVDAATVTSAEALDNLLALLGDEGRRRLRETPLFVPHERVAAHARDAGVREAIVAGAADGEMIARLVAYFSDERERARR